MRAGGAGPGPTCNASGRRGGVPPERYPRPHRFPADFGRPSRGGSGVVLGKSTGRADPTRAGRCVAMQREIDVDMIIVKDIGAGAKHRRELAASAGMDVLQEGPRLIVAPTSIAGDRNLAMNIEKWENLPSQQQRRHHPLKRYISNSIDQ